MSGGLYFSCENPVLAALPMAATDACPTRGTGPCAVGGEGVGFLSLCSMRSDYWLLTPDYLP